MSGAGDAARVGDNGEGPHLITQESNVIDDEPTPVGAEGVDGSEGAAIAGENVEAEVRVETDENEETPVIDVHAPHGGVHTWKDFWIHLGTITLGLLIAIGLEQSVEWVHHLHQRHQLEEDLHTEALRDHAVVTGDLRTFALERTRLLGLRHDVERMRDSGGKLKLAYTPKPTVDPDTGKLIPLMALPSEAVWSTAEKSELGELLPRPVAEMYARHSVQHEFLTNALNLWLDHTTNQKAFEYRFEDGGPASTPDLSRMTPAELDEYSAMLAKDLALRDRIVNRLGLFDSQTRDILGGAASEEDLMGSRKFDLEK